MAKSVKWLFNAGGGQCLLLKCWFRVKIEVWSTATNPFHLLRKTKNVIGVKKKILIFAFLKLFSVVASVWNRPAASMY